jgi:hypothetical protein
LFKAAKDLRSPADELVDETGRKLLIQWDQRGFGGKVTGGRLVAVNTVL